MKPRTFVQSIVHACRGVRYVFAHEQNFRIQVIAAVAVFVVGLLVGLTRAEMVIIAMLSVAVLVLELINSAVEAVADIVKPRLSNHVAVVKDIMAGAVLIVSMGALVVGFFIFWPHILDLIEAI